MKKISLFLIIVLAIAGIAGIVKTVHSQDTQDYNWSGIFTVTTHTCQALQNTINQAIAIGGATVDARRIGNVTCSSELDVGSSSNIPVTLLLPSSGAWTFNITDGTSFALKVFDKSAVISESATGEGLPFSIVASSTSAVGAVCGNDSSGLYVRIQGFGCTTSGGATVSSAICAFSTMADEATVRDMVCAPSGSVSISKNLWIHDSCCSAHFENINAESVGVTVPCTFDSNSAIRVIGLSCIHPGHSESAIVIHQNASAGGNSLFQNIYMEQLFGGENTNFQDATTPYIQCLVVGSPTMADILQNITANFDTSNSTRYMVDLAQGCHLTMRDLRSSNISMNVINDHNTSGGTFTATTNTSVLGYTTEKALGSATATP